MIRGQAKDRKKDLTKRSFRLITLRPPSNLPCKLRIRRKMNKIAAKEDLSRLVMTTMTP
jgi:hypothetical protein